MMYRMKKIITHDDEITLPKCMYMLKKIFTIEKFSESYENAEINIAQQVIKFLQGSRKEMAELEKRQDQLLKKLDFLYDKIKSVSTICQTKEDVKPRVKKSIPSPDEVVLTASADNIPWFLPMILKKITSPVNVHWHIHSSVPNEKVAKIKAFVKDLQSSGSNAKVTLRLIFKSVSEDTELKLSSLAVPVVGNVNILRYLSLVYPDIIPYDDSDYSVDGLLDQCHVLERASENNKEAAVKNLFAQYDGWIYKKCFCIVDLAAYNVIKQWRNCPKYVPKDWFDKISKY